MEDATLFPCKDDGTPRIPKGMLPIVVVPEFGSKDAKLKLVVEGLFWLSDNETLFWASLLVLEASETG